MLGQVVLLYLVALGAGTGVVHLVFLVAVLLRRQRDRSGGLAPIYLGLVLLWTAALTLGELEPAFVSVFTRSGEQLLPIFATGLMVLQVLMICTFLEIPARTALAAAGGTWCVVLLAVGIYLLFRPAPGVPLYEVTIGGWSVLGLTMIALAAIGHRRSRLAWHRNRVLYWVLVFIPLTAGQAASLLTNNPLREAGPLIHLFGAAALVRGALSIWLPNVKATLRTTLRYLLLAIATALFLMGIVVGAEALTGSPVLPLPRPVLIGVLAAFATLIYIPVYRLFLRLADRLFEGVGFDPAQALREYSQTIGTLLSSEQLATAAAGTVMEVVGIRRGALLVATETERGGIQLQPVPGLGEVLQEPLEMEAISPVLARLKEQDDPVFQYEVEHHLILRSAASREREWMRALDMEIYLPIRSQGELVGVLALGSQRSDEPYGPREIEFLTMLANQTAVALQNARLFEGLQALNARIVQLNENLRTAYEKLERMDQAKSDFLTIASHELRTPLTQVRGYVDVLNELASTGTLTNDQVLRISENISKPTHRLENIVNALLDSSRIDAEGLSLRFVPSTVALTLRLASESVQEALEERSINLLVQGAEDMPPIRLDMERMIQALGNIMSNAIKFTPDGGRITIDAHPLDAEHFEITIQDTGIGISRADQTLIFEKFYRVGSVSLHSSGDYKFKGAGPGLGLPIARGVIEGHGGCVWVESEGYDEERCPGSTFHIVLPYQAHRGKCKWKRLDLEAGVGLPLSEGAQGEGFTLARVDL
jgi:signal transduction histidine kinase